jgi:acetyltransferase-like isoleucine patch superfamily enzyme
MHKVIDFIFYKFLPIFLVFYEKHLFFRIRKAYGYAMTRIIKNKGKDLRIHGRCTIIRQDYLEIGDYVRIGNNCYFFCIGGIKIGNNVQFSRDIVIYASNHNYNSTAIPYDMSYNSKKSVVIEDNVWIGMGASILPGVTIGEGAIIGMNTVISKNVPKYAIVVGADQRVIGYRDKNHYDQLNIDKRWFGKLFPNA